jgi:hypothetical protein
MLRFIHAVGLLILAVLVHVHACTQKIILVFVCGTYVPTLAYLWYLVCVSGMSVRPYPPHHMGRTQLCDDFFHTHLEIFLSILF